jgi:hypothetical protein
MEVLDNAVNMDHVELPTGTWPNMSFRIQFLRVNTSASGNFENAFCHLIQDTLSSDTLSKYLEIKMNKVRLWFTCCFILV